MYSQVYCTSATVHHYITVTYIEQTKMEHNRIIALIFGSVALGKQISGKYNTTTVLLYCLGVLLHFLISCGKTSHCHYPSCFTVTPQFSQCNTPFARNCIVYPGSNGQLYNSAFDWFENYSRIFP